jgi:hypothetical protein
VVQLQGLNIQTIYKERSAHLQFPNGKTVRLHQGKDYLAYLHPVRIAPAEATVKAPIGVITFKEGSALENIERIAKEIPNFSMFGMTPRPITSAGGGMTGPASFFTSMTGMLQEPGFSSGQPGSSADGEVIAYFRSPTGEMLCVSSLFKVSQTQTPSLDFFKQFITYGASNQIALNGWSLEQMVPGDGSYFTYEGSNIIPDCSPYEWIVFKSMINMDPTDFATLVRTTQAGSRSIQGLGTRELFYNDSASSSSYLPHDNKTYLVMRPLGKNKHKKVEPLKKADLKTTEAIENAKQPSTISQVGKNVSDNLNEYVVSLIWLLMFGLSFAGLYYYGNKVKILVYIYNWFRKLFGRDPLIENPIVPPILADNGTSV